MTKSIQDYFFFLKGYAHWAHLESVEKYLAVLCDGTSVFNELFGANYEFMGSMVEYFEFIETHPYE